MIAKTQPPSSSSIGLSALIYPTLPADFFRKHWPETPFVVHTQGHGLNATLQELTSLPFLESLDTLLGSWPKLVQAHLPDLKDEASAIDVLPSDARKLFKNKMALLFNHAETLSPVLVKWIAALKADLGLPTMTFGRCILYATPDNRGTAPHFDQNINFVMQLQGTKKWTIAANEHVLHPSQRQTMGLDIDPELEAYSDLPLPTEMPKHSEEIILKPGSLLFLPRGYWHSTEATGEALALNFTFSQPSWIDLFTTALKSRLSLSPEWRELADGVTSRDLDQRAIAEAKFDALLLELVDDLPHWRAADILGATEGSLYP